MVSAGMRLESRGMFLLCRPKPPITIRTLTVLHHKVIVQVVLKGSVKLHHIWNPGKVVGRVMDPWVNAAAVLSSTCSTSMSTLVSVLHTP